MERIHISQMHRIAPDATNIALISDFDPTATPGAEIDDPWYGPSDGFVVTLIEIERAVAGLLTRLESGEL